MCDRQVPVRFAFYPADPIKRKTLESTSPQITLTG